MSDDPLGEIALDLGAVSLTLRPTFEAQRRIQRDLGEGLMSVANRVFEGNFGIEEVFVIVRHGAEAVPGQEVDEDRIGDLIARRGLRKMTEPTLAFLAMVIGGWGDEEKKTRPASSESTKSNGDA